MIMQNRSFINEIHEAKRHLHPKGSRSKVHPKGQLFIPNPSEHFLLFHCRGKIENKVKLDPST